MTGTWPTGPPNSERSNVVVGDTPSIHFIEFTLTINIGVGVRVGMAYCQRCDKTLDTGEYCPDCGSELVQPTGRVESSSPEPSESGRAMDSTDGWGESEPGTAVEEEGEDYFERGPLNFSFTYSISDGWEQLLITAGLLFLGGIIIFPYIFVYGYAYRLGRAVIRGDHRPPTYGDWGGLFKDGVLLFVVGLPFGLLMLALVAVPFLVGGAVDSGLVSAISVPLWIAGFYVGGGILPTFMATGSVRETYSDFRFLEFVRTTDYLKALLLGFVTLFVSVFVMLVALFVLVVTIVGIFVAIPLAIVAQPIILFFPFLLLAYYYRDAMLQGKVSPMTNESTLASQL